MTHYNDLSVAEQQLTKRWPEVLSERSMESLAGLVVLDLRAGRRGEKSDGAGRMCLRTISAEICEGGGG